MQLFYAADFTAPEYMLSEEESRHSAPAPNKKLC